jgi:hypothetical protein
MNQLGRGASLARGGMFAYLGVLADLSDVPLNAVQENFKVVVNKDILKHVNLDYSDKVQYNADQLGIFNSFIE